MAFPCGCKQSARFFPLMLASAVTPRTWSDPLMIQCVVCQAIYRWDPDVPGWRRANLQEDLERVTNPA